MSHVYHSTYHIRLAKMQGSARNIKGRVSGSWQSIECLLSCVFQIDPKYSSVDLFYYTKEVEGEPYSHLSWTYGSRLAGEIAAWDSLLRSPVVALGPLGDGVVQVGPSNA